MSRIYDALKKLEAERARKAAEARARQREAEEAKTSAPDAAPTEPPAAAGPAEPAAAHGNGDATQTDGVEAHPNGGAARANGGGAHANGGNGHHANGGNGHHGNGHSNGHGNGKRNGNGNGNGRRGWRWLFPTNGHGNGHHKAGISFDLGPEVEEAYQRLGTNLLMPIGTESAVPRLLGLTASRHGEGTTTTAAVFASVLVRRRGGRVAIVEANFRSPSVDTVFGVRRDAGFADLVQGRKSVAEVAQQTAIPNLFAIPCGVSTFGAPGLLDSTGVGPALDALRAQFDFVIFDLPPANVYADASILAPRLDAALIVIEADRARIPEVERVRRALDRVGVRLAGTILNRRRQYIPAFLEEML